MSKLYSMLSSLSGGAAVALIAIAVMAFPVQNVNASGGGGINYATCITTEGPGGKCAGCDNAGVQCMIGGNLGTCGPLSSQCCECNRAQP